MFGQIFSNRAIRKYVIFFGSLFDNVYLTRDNIDGDRKQTMRVPLNYGPKEKFLARLEGNPDLDREIAIQLPRMSFEITNMYYDSSRRLSSVGKVTCPETGASFQYNPIPYNIDFNLYIMTKNIEDGYRILESIIPFFGPDFTGSVILGRMNTYDVPVILKSIDHTDSFEGQFNVRRALIWTITFTLKGYIFGPERTSSVIKRSEVNIKIPNDINNLDPATPNSVEIVVTAGLTVDGEPTEDPDLAIDWNLVNPDDNYAFIKDIEEFL